MLDNQRVFLTALGARLGSVAYQLHPGGPIVEEPLAPLALLRLLPDRARSPTMCLHSVLKGPKTTTWQTFAGGSAHSEHNARVFGHFRWEDQRRNSPNRGINCGEVL